MKPEIVFRFKIESACSVPMYIQFKDQLKDNICRQKIAPGTRLPDIVTLAASANIGVKTAYKGLNELVKERFCFKRPKKGTFVGNGKAVTKARKKICCIYYQPANIAALEKNILLGSIYHGLASKAIDLGVDMFFLTGDPVDSLEFYLKNEKIELSGVIMLEWECSKEGIRLAEIFPEINFIYLNFHSEEFENMPQNIYGIFNDDFGGAYQAAEYLIKAEHKDMAILSVKLHEDNYRKRIDGFRQSLKENNYDEDEHLQVIIHPSKATSIEELRSIGYKLTKQVFSNEPFPTALFAVNDFLAQGALDYLKEYKLSDQVELLGYDNVVPEISRKNNFSTVAIDFHRMGSFAMDLLAGTVKYYSKNMLLTPQLLIRAKN
jgi:DNA-binding LacI/PurR family transcriptional regulator